MLPPLSFSQRMGEGRGTTLEPGAAPGGAGTATSWIAATGKENEVTVRKCGLSFPVQLCLPTANIAITGQGDPRLSGTSVTVM